MRDNWLIILISMLLPAMAAASSTLPVPVSNALSYRNVPEEALSIYVEDLATGEVVLTWNDARPRNPASVEKMVTTLVALDTLGPAYRWKTEATLLGDAEDGVLDGDLL